MNFDHKLGATKSELAPSHQSDYGAATPPHLTAATAIQLISGWPDISAGNRREWISAVNTIARVSGLPAEMLFLTPQRLRETVLGKSAAGWGMKSSSKSNALYRLGQVLKRLDIIDTVPNDLTQDWASLLGMADEHTRKCLPKFFKFCTARNIRPISVTGLTLLEFEVWLTERTIIAEPRTTMTAVRRAWNNAAQDIPAWPKTQLPLENRRRQFLLPFAAFPASLNDDVKKYVEKVSGENIDDNFGINLDIEDDEFADDSSTEKSDYKFGQNGAMKPLRPITVTTKLQTLLVAMNSLSRSGTPIEQITSLACLVTPLNNPKAILVQLMKENGGITSPKIGHTADMLRQIAKYHIPCPTKHIEQISTWVHKLRVKYPDMTRRNRQLLEQISTPARRLALQLLPEALLKEAFEHGQTSRGAVAAQRAAMIELLSKCPMRLYNLLSLRIDRHLMRPDPKVDRITAIIIEAPDMKNEQPMTYPVSETIANILNTWIKRFRPMFATPENPYLFPGRDMRPMTRAGIRDSIKTITHERIGIAINPHAFRHLSAEIFLQSRPGDYENVRRLLGHKNLETTTRAYCQNESKTAMVLFDQILETSLAELGVRKQPSKRKHKKLSKPQNVKNKKDSA